MKTHLVTTCPEATLSQALDLMDLYRVMVLPVVDTRGRLLGLLRERDIVADLARAVSTSAMNVLAVEANSGRLDAVRAVGHRPVSELMHPIGLAPVETENLVDLIPALLAQDLERVPVLDDSGRVVGTLERIDVCQAIFEGHDF